MFVLITHPTSPAHQQKPQTQAATTKLFSYFAVNTSWSGWGQTCLTSRFIVSPSSFPCAGPTPPSPHPAPRPRPLLALSPSLPGGARAGEEPLAESPCRPPGQGWTARGRPTAPAVLEPRSHLAAARVATQATSGDPAGSCVRGRSREGQAHGALGRGLACADAPGTSSATYGQQGHSRWAGALAGPGPPDEARAPPHGEREHLEPGMRGPANRR